MPVVIFVVSALRIGFRDVRRISYLTLDQHRPSDLLMSSNSPSPSSSDDNAIKILEFIADWPCYQGKQPITRSDGTVLLARRPVIVPHHTGKWYVVCVGLYVGIFLEW